MSYVNKHLMAGEQVAYRTRVSQTIFLWPLILALAGIALLIYGWMRFKAGPPRLDLGIVLLVLGAALILAGLWKFLPRLVEFSSSEFAVTNRRVIVKVGWARRRSIETLLSKIEAIEVIQGVAGRMMNYGTIIVIGTGGTKEPFDRIARPLEFRRKVQEQILALQYHTEPGPV